MAISRTITHHPKAVEIKLPRLYVVAWLANANGEPVTSMTAQNATYIRAELFEDRDEAWHKGEEMREAEALFYSVQDDRGESII